MHRVPRGTMTDDTVTVTISAAHALGCAVLENIGLTVDEAGIVLDHLIDNSLCGYRFAGLPRILAIADSAEIKRPRTRLPSSMRRRCPPGSMAEITSATS